MTELNPLDNKPRNLSSDPLSILREAITAVPAVRYGLGVAGIAAVAAIIATLMGGYSKVAIISIGLVLIGMFVLFLFSILVTSKSDNVKYAGFVLLWSVTIFVILFMGFTASAAMTGLPCNWSQFLNFRSKCDGLSVIQQNNPSTALLAFVNQSKRQGGDIANAKTYESQYWLQPDIRNQIKRIRNCIDNKKCDSEDLLHFIADTVLKDRDSEQFRRVQTISDFYINIVTEAHAGTIDIGNACACFVEEITTWQRSYLYVLDELSEINGRPYQSLLAKFAFKDCDKYPNPSPCPG